MRLTALVSRRPIARSLGIVAVTPFLLFSACTASQPSAKGVLTSTVAAGKSAVVAIENGRIEFIEDPAASGVQITAHVRCYGKDQAEADARLRGTALVAQCDAAGKVQISINAPKRSGAGWINMNSDVAHITVRAADLSGINATTSNGDITIGGFSGEAILETSNGDIAVNTHAGAVNASTSNGSIKLAGVPSAVADTSNGDIDVALAGGATGDLTLETSNGSVTVDLSAAWQGTLVAETSLGSLDLSGGAVTKSGDAKTMKVGDASKATATIKTSLGSVTVRPAKQ